MASNSHFRQLKPKGFSITVLLVRDYDVRFCLFRCLDGEVRAVELDGTSIGPIIGKLRNNAILYGQR